MATMSSSAFPRRSGHRPGRRTRRLAIRLAGAAAIIGCLAACGGNAPSTSRAPSVAADFRPLTGWTDDRVGEALPALLQSCSRVVDRPVVVRASLGQITTSSDDWRQICTAARSIPAHNAGAARQFFERWFVPVAVPGEGLITGYFAPELRGSWRRTETYDTPIYRLPPRRSGRLPPRAQIADGALAGRGLEILWVDDAVDAFFLEIQGSGYARMTDGSRVHLGYAGQNGHRYYAVGRALIDRGETTRENMSMQFIRDWLDRHPDEAQDLMNLNPSFIFFELRDGEVRGAQDVPLTAGRSIAVDRDYIPLGLPLWIDLRNAPTGDGRLQRLVVAQDVGGAIRGPVRGDLFWGAGDAAGELAGGMQARGRFHMLVPRSSLARRVAEQTTVSAR